MNILILEDNDDLREILLEDFRMRGFEVFGGVNGVDGLKILSSQKIDVVLTDVQMPEMNGLDFLVKAKEKFFHCPPIYIMSGFSPYNQEKFDKAGAAGFYEKPLDVDVLIEAINKRK